MHCLLKWIKFSVKKTKHLKNTGKMAKNTGKVREFCQSGKVGTLMLCMIASLKETSHPSVTDCSHGTITDAIYLSQLMGCMEFGLFVAIAPCEHLTLNPIQPICCDKKSQSQSYNANSPVVGGLLE